MRQPKGMKRFVWGDCIFNATLKGHESETRENAIHGKMTRERSMVHEVVLGVKYEKQQECRSLWLGWRGQGVRAVGRGRSHRLFELKEGVCIFVKSDRKPLGILGQGNNTICLGGKLDSLNSVKEILNKSLHYASLNLLFLRLPWSLYIRAVL